MPLFDFWCPVCGDQRELYVASLHTEVLCFECGEDHIYNPDLPPPRAMVRQKFAPGTRSTFDVRGYNAHNGYGMRWDNNPSDIKARGLT